MAKIRGLAFLGAIRHIKHSYGQEKLTELIRDGGPHVRETFRSRVNGLALYPYDALIELLVAVDKKFGKGDLEYCKVVGDLAARNDLETIFKVYKIKPSPEKMIVACTPIWGMYTEDAGYMEAVSTDPKGTILRITGFPKMHPAHCRLMEGWMIAAMDIVGVNVLPGACETECMSEGGRYHEFWCQWQLKTDGS